ncbi:gustatory receptor for sugar taste 64a-like [Danaus plexippus]|uniref:gustatory receptor for sugar taste 64a-like n=1 Tax=Danaus plexippus TaxID=13037 RepID=UPI002AB214EB|nr:gustatory receptor for sugar taste 64a-like [Danaus plexippus]
MSKIKKVVIKEKTRIDMLLPHQPHHDDFIHTLTNVLSWSRWVGIVGLKRHIWKLYGACMMCLLLAIEFRAIYKVFKALAGWAVDTVGHRSVTARLAGTMFYSAAIFALIQCNYLSHSWKETSKYWSSLEWELSNKHVPIDKTLRRRMYRSALILIFCTAAIYLMNYLVVIDFKCKISYCLKTFVLKTHGFMLLEREYSDWIGVFILFVHVISNIIWTLQNLFIILMGMGLTSRYKRLNSYVATVVRGNDRKEKMSEKLRNQEVLLVYTWKKIREAYTKQAILVHRVNKSLGGLILVSSFFDFYFICLQLFYGIVQGISSDGIKHLYFLIHFSWVCGRTVYTILSAAYVNEYSKLALPHLYKCDSQFYNTEMKRLQRQISRENIALSGMGFFNLRRSIILQMAGIAVTYVLVLVQYDGSDDQILTNSTDASFK